MNGGGQRRNALVLYGTETGTAQDLAEELGRVTERLRFSTRIAELDDVTVNLLSSFTVTIFVISTTGQGEFPSNAKTFWTSLLKKRLPATLLQDVPFFLLGLGDTSYPKFNWAARKLGKRLKQLGAIEVIESCEADEQGEDSTDGAFLAWLPLFKTALLEEFPLPDGLRSIPDDQQLPSKWLLESAPILMNGHKPDSSGVKNGYYHNGRETLNDHVSSSHAYEHSRPISDSFPVFVEKNERVTPSSHWQDVRLLSLTTNQSIDYLPGDALSIMPENFPEDVTTLIHLMDWTSVADHQIMLVPSSKYAHPTNYPPCPIPEIPASTTVITLRNLLTSYLDITSIPRRSLFTTLSRYTSDPTHRDRLLEFTLPQYLDEYYDYATRPRRSILEILQEFDSAKIPWQEAINVFPLLRGRQFSIASGGKQRRLSEEGNSKGTRFELLVAIVKYKTVMKKTRLGVCTRYLASLPPGSTLNVIHRTDGRFSTKTSKPSPKNTTTSTTNSSSDTIPPKLLIGAGTGIAPLRALIHSDEQQQQQALLNHDIPLTTTTLFFGCRNQHTDFFFADEWTSRQSSYNPSNPAKFTLIPAFSRDQPHKIYLQDRLREHAAHVFDLLVRRNAIVVVGGSSGAMPKAVRLALRDVLVGEGGGGEDGGGNWTVEEAERYLVEMERGGRYLQETW